MAHIAELLAELAQRRTGGEGKEGGERGGTEDEEEANMDST